MENGIVVSLMFVYLSGDINTGIYVHAYFYTMRLYACLCVSMWEHVLLCVWKYKYLFLMIRINLKWVKHHIIYILWVLIYMFLFVIYIYIFYYLVCVHVCGEREMKECSAVYILWALLYMYMIDINFIYSIILCVRESISVF